MIRTFDFCFSLAGLILLFPVMAVIYVLGLFDTGSPIFVQTRMGKNCQPFRLIKFRSMRVGTTSTASHLASVSSITKFGKFLRKTKLDELPQLWNVLKGDMSLVGPRPNLLSQLDLIAERKSYDIYRARPGITGLAQVKNIDMSEPSLLSKTDAEMINSMNLKVYFNLILKTIVGQGSGDVVGKV